VDSLGQTPLSLVLVHGLWNRGWSMTAMAKRLRAKGHHVHVFSYPTRGKDLDGHADELRSYLRGINAGVLHLVGHSMGGLVILNMLGRHTDLAPGRVVLMGTPVKGASVLKRLEKLPGQEFVFGKSRDSLLRGITDTEPGRETGMIRGTRSFGLGQLVGGHDEPNDGSITVGETELDGLKDSVELPVSHSEMLVSAEVVEQVEQFLLHGEFKKDR
jgi:pimeloyl-ACP methyl ester carboxylesterase